jgi:hypothetical protein
MHQLQQHHKLVERPMLLLQEEARLIQVHILLAHTMMEVFPIHGMEDTVNHMALPAHNKPQQEDRDIITIHHIHPIHPPRILAEEDTTAPVRLWEHRDHHQLQESSPTTRIMVISLGSIIRIMEHRPAVPLMVLYMAHLLIHQILQL